MDKRALIIQATKHTTLTQKQVHQALDALLLTIENALAAGNRVNLSDFGRFEMQIYTARKLSRFDGEGHFEATARVIPVFKSSIALRRRLQSREGNDA